MNYFSTDAIFWVAALFGTLLFLPKIFSWGLAEDLSSESDLSFSIFSTHSLSGFFMMFGWVGLAASKQFDLGDVWSVCAALAGGCTMLWLTAQIFRLASKLVSNGAEYSLEDSLGQHVTVYLQIPPKGRGVVQVSLSGMTREIEAVSESPDLIPSFSNVEVVAVLDSRTVRVKAI